MVLFHILTILSATGLFLAFETPYWFLGIISLIPFIYCLSELKTYSANFLYKQLLIGSLFGITYMGLTNLWVFELIEFSSIPEIIGLFFSYTLLEALYFTALSYILYLLNRLWCLPFLWTQLNGQKYR